MLMTEVFANEISLGWVFAPARKLPIFLNIYWIFCLDDFDRIECFATTPIIISSNCLLIMLLLHVQAARTSCRFSSKAVHCADLS